MKNILISIKPKWVAKILNGEKTIEVRKSMPKCELPIDVYIYCTKDSNGLVWDNNGKGLVNAKLFPYSKGSPEHNRLVNGKVVAKFTLNKVVPIVMQMGADTGYGNNGYVGYGHCEKDNFKFMFDIEKETCLEHNEELCKYLNNGKNFDDIYINKLKANVGYAWHISNLVIFDKPKKLSEFVVKKQTIPDESCEFCCDFKRPCNKCYSKYELTKAPQSYCYIEVD